MKPICVTCPQLLGAFSFLTDLDPWAQDTLVDLWLTGAPDPHMPREWFNAIRDLGPAYDPRRDPYTRRWIYPDTIKAWVGDVFGRLGWPLSDEQLTNIVAGKPVAFVAEDVL